MRGSTGRSVGLLRYAPKAASRGGALKMLADVGSRRELFPVPEMIGSALLWLVGGGPLGEPEPGEPSSAGSQVAA